MQGGGQFRKPGTDRRVDVVMIEFESQRGDEVRIGAEVGEVLEREVDRMCDLTRGAQASKLGLLSGVTGHVAIVNP